MREELTKRREKRPSWLFALPRFVYMEVYYASPCPIIGILEEASSTHEEALLMILQFVEEECTEACLNPFCLLVG